LNKRGKVDQETNESIIAKIQSQTDKEARNKLLQELYLNNIKLIGKVGSLLYENFYEPHKEDLRHNGYMVMLDCVNKFDLSRGCKFSTYFYKSLCKKFSTMYKSLVEDLKNTTHFDSPQASCLSNDNFYDNTEYLDNKIDCESIVNEITKDLDDREKQIIKLRYYDDLPCKVVASMLGMTTQQLYREISIIMKKLKEKAKEV
jgi:RNA polymerase sigma factor (sigma-70 family)